MFIINITNNIIRTSDYELRNCSDAGYGAIHVACRYNNKFALTLLLDKGLSADLPDTSGNTPLHYASKYGNIDICKCLIERKCSAAKRNTQNLTPYDVAENHVVRQFLLPLQLTSEREAQEAAGINPMSQYGMPPVYSQQIPTSAPEYPVYSLGTQPIVPPEYPVYSLGTQAAVSISQPVSQSTISPPEYPVYAMGVQSTISNPSTSQPLTTIQPPQPLQNPVVNLAPKSGSGNNSPTAGFVKPPSTAVPPPVSTTIPQVSTIIPSSVSTTVPQISTAVPPSSQFQQAQPPFVAHIQSQPIPDNKPSIPVQTSAHMPHSQTFNNSNNKRAIQPDGFHSSASDPVLQARYGHIKADIKIAPPPTSFPATSSAPPQYGLYNNGINPTAPSNIYSRYVAYDVHTNSAMAPPPVHNMMPNYQPHYQNPSMLPTTILPTTTMLPTAIPTMPPPSNIPLSNIPPSNIPPSNIPPSNIYSQQQCNNPYNAPPLPINVQPNVAVFNPTTDEVISASSSSSSVL